MESKQTTPTGQELTGAPQAKAIGELSSRLSDIELKLDHIIDRIKDSLHRMEPPRREDWEEQP